MLFLCACVPIDPRKNKKNSNSACRNSSNRSVLMLSHTIVYTIDWNVSKSALLCTTSICFTWQTSSTDRIQGTPVAPVTPRLLRCNITIYRGICFLEVILVKNKTTVLPWKPDMSWCARYMILISIKMDHGSRVSKSMNLCHNWSSLEMYSVSKCKF